MWSRVSRKAIIARIPIGDNYARPVIGAFSWKRCRKNDNNLSRGKEEIGPEQIIICPKLFFMIYCRKEFEGKLHEPAETVEKGMTPRFRPSVGFPSFVS